MSGFQSVRVSQDGLRTLRIRNGGPLDRGSLSRDHDCLDIILSCHRDIRIWLASSRIDAMTAVLCRRQFAINDIVVHRSIQRTPGVIIWPVSICPILVGHHGSNWQLVEILLIDVEDDL